MWCVHMQRTCWTWLLSLTCGAGDRLFIGTVEGAILKYAINEVSDAEGKVTYRCELEGKRALSSKPIDRIVTVRDFAILIALTGTHIAHCKRTG
jgi:hypothetical protein